MFVREALREGAAALAGIEGGSRDARLLLEAATGLDRTALLLNPNRAIDPAPFRAMLVRRVAREPLAYIVGYQEFWSLRLAVSPATLIPRADTETLIEAAIAARPNGVTQILDLGTGTGCLLLAALSEFPAAWGVGIDRSAAAAALAGRNAVALGYATRCAIVCGQWGAAIDGQFDLVLSNPPYVRSDELAELMPEVANFEPAGALDGGWEGLDAYRSVVEQLPRLLRPGGLAVLELGLGQREAVAELARAHGFTRVSSRKDLAGIERALLIVR